MRGAAFAGLLVACALASYLWLLRRNPAILAARRGVHAQTEPWDRALLALFRLALLVEFVVAALDLAWFHWSHAPLAVLAAGFGLLALGWWLSVQALRWNEFAEPGVRIQAERGHRVVAEGPYAVVRHPMYAGLALAAVGAALALGSWPSLPAAACAVAVLVVRIVREERVLRAGLAGYAAYAARVRWRLVPGLW